MPYPRRIWTPRFFSNKPQSQRRPIILPQFVWRPLRIRRRVWQRSDIQPKVWWFVLHRRGFRRRPIVGIDPLEARAVPQEIVRGTLPERIVWQYLVSKLHFQPGVDFDFQSSLEGGRMNLGGMVVDFIFPYLKITLQVQGFHHRQFLQARKDAEQYINLKLRGYEVYELWEDEIYDEYVFEEIMRRIFGLPQGKFGSSYAWSGVDFDIQLIDIIYAKMVKFEQQLLSYLGV